MKLTPDNRKRIIESALERYTVGNDDVEIDPDAKILRAGDRGAWVQAWVYVNFQEIPERARPSCL